MDGAVAAPVVTQRSFAVGGGFATTEMRRAFTSIVDRTLAVAPVAVPTIYVDDLRFKAAGGENIVYQQLVGFALAF